MDKSIPIPQSRKIRIAIVGCGRISKNHFDSIIKHQNNIELVSVCDSEKEILNKHIISIKLKVISIYRLCSKMKI